MIVDLLRVEKNKIYVTFGVVLINSEVFSVSLEPIDIDKPLQEGLVDCIPEGTYICKRIISPKFGETFEITNVPNSSVVLFHAGNRVIDTHKCVLLGQYFDKLKEDRIITNSGNTFNKFMNVMLGINEFPINIYEWKRS